MIEVNSTKSFKRQQPMRSQIAGMMTMTTNRDIALHTIGTMTMTMMITVHMAAMSMVMDMAIGNGADLGCRTFLRDLAATTKQPTCCSVQHRVMRCTHSVLAEPADLGDFNAVDAQTLEMSIAHIDI